MFKRWQRTVESPSPADSNFVPIYIHKETQSKTKKEKLWNK